MRQPDGIDIDDLELDLVVLPDGERQWKDVEHLAARLDQRRFTLDDLRHVLAAAPDVADLLDRDDRWWAPWDDWTPAWAWATDHQPRCGENGGPVTVPNVLATRYASADLAEIWSPEHKIVLERRLWIAVLEAQRDLGVDVPDGVIEAYEDVVDNVDLDSIAARERVTRHDVKARIEEFSALAGHEHIHKGMTSRDLTENVEQLQVRQSLELRARPRRSPRWPGWRGWPPSTRTW